MSTLRLFTALPLPDTWQEALRALHAEMAEAPRMTWTRPGNWHLTLKFLGDVDAERMDALTRALDGVVFQPFDLRPAGGGFFPDARRPRVFWVGVRQGAEECAALAREVNRVLAPLGFAPEERPFRAHLTLARIRRPGGDFPALARHMADQATRWAAGLGAARMTEFVLYQSELSPAGPRYRRLRTFSALDTEAL